MHHSARLRQETHYFLVRYASAKVTQAFETVLADVRSNVLPGTEDSPHLHSLTRTGLDHFFHLGMRHLDRPVSSTDESRQQLDQAIRAFMKAWELRLLAAPTDQYLFPKALYGWGYAYEDRAWIEQDAHGMPHPDLVQAAQGKYRAFLTEVQHYAQTHAYPHREHLLHAETHLEQPTVRGTHTVLAWRLLSLTGSFETGADEPENFAGLSGNFDGQGISFGALQWNVGQGTLQPLLSDINRQSPGLVRTLFGPQYPALLGALGKTRQQQLAWARSIQDETHFLLHAPWRRAFKALGLRYAFQKIEVTHAKTLYRAALKLCERYNVRSERAAALMFDILVQNGGLGERVHAEIAKAVQALPAGGSPQQREVARLQMIANRVAEAAKPRWVEDVRRRKLTIANGTGTVHGKHYDLSARGITLRDYRAHKPLGLSQAIGPVANQARFQSHP